MYPGINYSICIYSINELDWQTDSIPNASPEYIMRQLQNVLCFYSACKIIYSFIKKSCSLSLTCYPPKDSSLTSFFLSLIME